MEYNRIVAVTGMPGLYEVLSSKTDGAIIRSLEDKSTKFVSSRIHNLSHLESIEVYTTRENVGLSDIFSSIKDSGTKLPDVKDNKALRTYFEKVYPDLDFERVYTSDLKKMIKWYEVLQQNNIDFTVKEKAEEVETSPQPKAEAPVKEAKEKKVATPKATESVKETAPKDTVKKQVTEKKAEVKKTETKKAETKKTEDKKAEVKKPAAKKTAKKEEPVKKEKPKKSAKSKK
jgi:uncharacterized protein DUF6852/uncharacterized protein DUF5606